MWQQRTGRPGGWWKQPGRGHGSPTQGLPWACSLEMLLQSAFPFVSSPIPRVLAESCSRELEGAQGVCSNSCIRKDVRFFSV